MSDDAPEDPDARVILLRRRDLLAAALASAAGCRRASSPERLPEPEVPSSPPEQSSCLGMRHREDLPLARRRPGDAAQVPPTDAAAPPPADPRDSGR